MVSFCDQLIDLLAEDFGQLIETLEAVLTSSRLQGLQIFAHILQLNLNLVFVFLADIGQLWATKMICFFIVLFDCGVGFVGIQRVSLFVVFD